MFLDIKQTYPEIPCLPHISCVTLLRLPILSKCRFLSSEIDVAHFAGVFGEIRKIYVGTSLMLNTE